LSVSLTPSIAATVPVGTVVTWSAFSSGPTASTWYRFRGARAGSDLHVIRDYSPLSSLDWTASQYEGVYNIEVTARDNSTGETAVDTASYQINPVVSGDAPVISPTANPLVFLYSAPPCPARASMRVEFRSSDGLIQTTPYRSCQPPCPPSNAVGAGAFPSPVPMYSCGPPLSMNFYIAGLRQNSVYSVQHVIWSHDRDRGEAFQYGPTLTLTTSEVPLHLSKFVVQQSPPSPGGILLHSNLYGPSFATDLTGNLVWVYNPPITFLTQVEFGGRFLGVISPTFVSSVAYDGTQEIFREFDVAGNTLRETNAMRLNEQLAPFGKRIGALHHDARTLADGTVMVLGSTEQMLTGVQGSGTVDVVGDIILILDRDLQLKWYWDAFDHLDTHRAATLGETCPGAGCPPLYLAKKANDWLHGDAVQFLADGNLLYSSRHQDWVIKIDYGNGAGAGDVIWRMGLGGDFQMNSSDPSPWFSHQHDPEFAAGDASLLTVFDDGNIRQAANSQAHSRGQALKVDEQARTVTLIVNVDLGGFSFALGTAQQVSGGYYYGGGWFIPQNDSLSLQTDDSGNPVYRLSDSEPEFRSYLLNDLYTPP
jgi:arylsulfate sulfotransferase